MAIIAAMMVCFNVSAQQMIKGTLRSQTGEPLPGASVSVKGTNTAVTTNSKGEFTINAPVGSVLVVSYIGYNNQEVTIADANTPLNIQMQANNQELQQVVVIGYQTVRRRDLTGAVSVVNSENTSKIVAASVAEQLQGTVPGVTVRNTGNPNQAPVIEIRGVASFADANPLYVIDGMIADANSTVNPDDIASIQVLKDASAAAIYGSRAANGVIIITTKKGRNGPNRIN